MLTKRIKEGLARDEPRQSLEGCLFNSHSVTLAQTTGNTFPRRHGNSSSGEDAPWNPGLPDV